jgi:hypothetical protein
MRLVTGAWISQIFLQMNLCIRAFDLSESADFLD